MNRRDLWTGIAVTLIMLSVYLPTISTTIGWTDTGELVAVAHTMGIAHPTGYPLMTTLARATLSIPAPGSALVRLNVLAAFLTASACGIFSVVVRRFLGLMWPAPPPGALNRYLDNGIAALSALMLGVSTTVWLQAISFEVYALHLFLALLLLLVLTHAISSSASDASGGFRMWALMTLIAGFGFSNHMTTLLLAPAVIFGYLSTYRDRNALYRTALRLVPFFAVGLSWYLVVYVRSHSSPPLNWGDPSSLENLFRHVSGKQYRVWMFSGTEVMRKQFGLFMSNLPREIFWPFLLFAIAGAGVAWKRSRRIFWVILLSLIGTIAYAVNYDIHEIGPYFLLAYVAVASFAAIGARKVADLLDGRGRIVLLAGVFGMVGVQYSASKDEVTAENTGVVEWFSRTVCDSVEDGATIITSKWDFLYSPSLSLQHVWKYRPDIHMIDYNLLKDRSWYVRQISDRMFSRDLEVLSTKDAFLLELHKFERGDPFSLGVIQSRWNSFIDAIVRSSIRTGDVYVDARLGAEFQSRFSLLPEGFLLRVDTASIQRVQRLPPKLPADLGRETDFLLDFKDYCATSYAQHAWVLWKSGLAEEADSVAGIAGSLNPANATVVTYYRIRRP
ncbi:MAG: hypothetical protein A3H45_09995 [Ignavibacteria bacterium RIFCSPLOWO2_02_FULL_55_14]|nr:MAG: hypothetical protein A3H45_09995 [Ignavibacteria bacterium RIFCSPLOWO2_02_FULL_55_14]